MKHHKYICREIDLKFRLFYQVIILFKCLCTPYRIAEISHFKLPCSPQIHALFTISTRWCMSKVKTISCTLLASKLLIINTCVGPSQVNLKPLCEWTYDFLWIFEVAKKSHYFKTWPSSKTIVGVLDPAQFVTLFQAIDRLLTSGTVLLRNCLSVLFSDAATFQTQKKVLRYIQYLFMVKTTHRKEKTKEVGWLCAAEACTLDAFKTLAYVFKTLPRGRFYSPISGLMEDKEKFGKRRNWSLCLPNDSICERK